MQSQQSIITIDELNKVISTDSMVGNFGELKRVSGATARNTLKSLTGIDISDSLEYFVITGLHFGPDTPQLSIRGNRARQNIIFIDCSFSNIVFQTAFCQNIILVNTAIHKHLLLHKTRIINFHLKSVSTPFLYIQNGSEIMKLVIHENTQIGSGLYTNGSKIHEFLFTGSVQKTEISFVGTSCKKVELKGCFQSIQIKGASSINQLSFSNSPNDKRLHCQHLLITEGSTCEQIDIGHFNCGHIFIQKKLTIEQLKVESATIGQLLVHQAKVLQTTIALSSLGLLLEDATTGSFTCLDSSFTMIQCKGEINGKFYFDGGEISELFFLKSVLIKDSIFSVASMPVNRLVFEQLLVVGQLQFKEIHSTSQKIMLSWGEQAFPSLSMLDLAWLMRAGIDHANWNHPSQTAEGPLLSQQTHYSPSQLIICRSSLGKTEFIGCDLSAYQFLYRNSKLLEIFFAGTTLPKYDTAINISPGQNKAIPKQEYIEQKISLYSQLKRVFDNQGNIVESNYFHSWAMCYQQKLLTYQVRTTWRKRKGLLDMIFDWLAFLLNRVSNNYGESWWRALRFIVIVTLITFIPAVWAMKYHFDWNLITKAKGWRFLTDFRAIWENLHKLPGFFLPTHRMEFMADGTNYHPGFSHYFWDLFSRILIGYGIYQFISAFRRHSRKTA